MKKKRKKISFHTFNVFECSFGAIKYLLRFSLLTNTSYYQIKHHVYFKNLWSSFSTIDITLNPLYKISNRTIDYLRVFIFFSSCLFYRLLSRSATLINIIMIRNSEYRMFPAFSWQGTLKKKSVLKRVLLGVNLTIRYFFLA